VTKDPCPDPGTIAEVVAGTASEEAWRRAVRHLADCAACRRHVSILARAAEARLPEASTVPPFPAAPRPKGGFPLLRAAAAALLLGALAWALLEARIPRRPPERQVTVIPPPAPTPPAPPAPDPAPEPSPLPRREPEPVPAAPVPPPAPTPRPEPPPASPPADLRLALRSPRGVTEAVEIAARDGALTVVSEGASLPLPKTRTLGPSDSLRADAAGSFAFPDGTTVHLPAGAEVAVSFSQTHLCPAIDLRRGSALIDVGAEPRPVHVSSGALGVRLGEVSGSVLVAAAPESLRATPLAGTARLRAPSGTDRVLGARQTLVLRETDDAIEPLADPEPAAAFPTAQDAAREPDVPAPGAPSPAPADPRALCAALGRDSYRYRVSGRFLREGAWAPAGLFVSVIDDFTAVRRIQDDAPAHLRRGNRDWDNLGTVTRGSREEKVLDALRLAQAPHAQLAQALAGARGEPRASTRHVMDRPCLVLGIPLDPARIRGEVSTLLQQAVAEGRLQAPDAVAWETLEGTVELSVTKHDPRILRAADRRRVAYSLKARAVNRQWYHLETVYEFSDHGQAALRLPPEMLRALLPDRK